MSARIDTHGGVPTLFVDGEPRPALAYMTYNLQERHLAAFARAGVRLFSFSTNSDYDYYGFSAGARPAEDEYDYGQFDERMETVLRAAPGAMVFPRVYVCSPPWWDRANPGELMAGRAGVYSPSPDFGWLPVGMEGAVRWRGGPVPEKMTVPSFASEKWLRDSGAALGRFVRHAEERYGDRIIGYHVCSGGSQEWYYWGAFEDVFPDTSAPQERAFGAWLAAKGCLSEESAAAVRIPGVHERTASEYGVFRDPKDPAARLATLYWRFHCEVLVEAMGRLVRVVREEAGPDKLIGVFYGYFVDLSRHPTAWLNSGHLALRKVLGNEDIDFVSSPTAYRDRRMGSGTSVFNSATESVAHHGKLWWNENDILTHNSPPLGDPLFHRPATPRGEAAASESRHLQRREFANTLCHGAGMWWFDMWGGYYDDEEHMRDVARMVAIAERALRVDMSPVAEIAVVLDDESLLHMECTNRLTQPLIADQLIELGHVGAPFSVVHVDDLTGLTRQRRHRFYIFLDLFHVTERRLEAVRRVADAPGATCLYVYAPGLVGESISVGRMERLTGIRLAVREEAAPLRVRTLPRRGLPEREYGTEAPIAPVVYADDPAAEVLGRILSLGLGDPFDKLRAAVLSAPKGGGLAGLVRKQSGDRVAVFSSAPRIPAAVLAHLMNESGVHLYTGGGETVYANRSLVAVFAMPGSRPELRLPRPGALYDVFEEKELGAGGTIRLPASRDGAWVLFRGTREEWERG